MYSTNYRNFGRASLPPNYRLTNEIAWSDARMQPMIDANSFFFDMFIDGTVAGDYSTLTTYGYHDIAIYDKSMYLSLQDSNLNNPVTDADWWYKVNDSFIGVYERIAYNASKLIFEYALNRWFGGTFAQPPSTSDIYITNTTTDPQSFVIGLGDEDSSAVGTNISTGFVGNTTVYDATVDFTINIPTALYPAGGDEEVRQFADLINTSGLIYNIVQY